MRVRTLLAVMLMPLLQVEDYREGSAAQDISTDDRLVLEAVFPQIKLAAGGSLVRSEDLAQVFVFDRARPVCRPKVTEHEPPWPYDCVHNPFGP
jgi:hypothetical protein